MTAFKNSRLVLAFCMTAGVTAAQATTSGHTLQNTRLTIVFGSTASGYTTNDADRVDAISWVNSAGATVTNYVTAGGPQHCGDPQEYFGEAYGDSGDEGVPRPNAVIGGVTSVWTGTTATKGTTAVKSLTSCDETLDATTKTQYTVSTKPAMINTLKIVRTFKFSKSASTGNMRAYVPRLRLSIYPKTLVPNAAGVPQTFVASNCPVNCNVTDWNGKWIADDDGNGNGVAMFRDPTKNQPAQVTVDWDGFSSSNNSAVTVIRPTTGWKGRVTETEYLCFYDAASWTAAARGKGKPPVGCNGVPH